MTLWNISLHLGNIPESFSSFGQHSGMLSFISATFQNASLYLATFQNFPRLFSLKDLLLDLFLVLHPPLAVLCAGFKVGVCDCVPAAPSRVSICNLFASVNVSVCLRSVSSACIFKSSDWQVNRWKLPQKRFVLAFVLIRSEITFLLGNGSKITAGEGGREGALWFQPGTTLSLS